MLNLAQRRLVTDRETGRQKGFGFCEYYDKDTAQSAIRNLGGHEVNGRHLRVDCTDASNEKGDRSMCGICPLYHLHSNCL